jgi:hypothetical protein
MVNVRTKDGNYLVKDIGVTLLSACPPGFVQPVIYRNKDYLQVFYQPLY